MSRVCSGVAKEIPHREGTFWCSECKAYTNWRPLKRGRREKCETCGTVYPCVHACGHRDCALERQALGIVPAITEKSQEEQK